MLPVVVNEQRTAWIILLHTLALVGVSLVPFFFGMSWIYLAGALAGGAYFVKTSFSFLQQPGPKTAIKNFHASLLQLSLLLIAVMLDAWLMV